MDYRALKVAFGSKIRTKTVAGTDDEKIQSAAFYCHSPLLLTTRFPLLLIEISFIALSKL